MSSQTHTIASDSRIIYYYSDEYRGEELWVREPGCIFYTFSLSLTRFHTHTRTHKDLEYPRRVCVRVQKHAQFGSV